MQKRSKRHRLSFEKNDFLSSRLHHACPWVNRLKIFIQLERLFISLCRATNMRHDSHVTLELFDGKVIPVCTYFTLTIHLLHYCTAHEYLWCNLLRFSTAHHCIHPIDAPCKTEVSALTQLLRFCINTAGYLLHSCTVLESQLLHFAFRGHVFTSFLHFIFLYLSIG